MYKGQNNVDGTEVTVRVQDIKPGNAGRRLVTELQILKKVCHVNINSYIDSILQGDKFYIIMEYVDGLTVTELSAKYQLGPGTVAAICDRALQGLNFLHQRKIVHRDIKGRNILLGKTGQVKIANFRMSIKEEEDSKRGVGTPAFYITRSADDPGREGINHTATWAAWH